MIALSVLLALSLAYNVTCFVALGKLRKEADDLKDRVDRFVWLQNDVTDRASALEIQKIRVEREYAATADELQSLKQRIKAFAEDVCE